MKRRLCLILALCTIVVSIQIRAHHSDEAVYRVTAETEIRGKVSQIQIRNPHSWIFIDVEDDKGVVTRWGGEWRAATQLQKEGISNNSLKIAEEVSIKGRPARNPQDHRVLVLTVTRTSDGKVFGAQRDRATN